VEVVVVVTNHYLPRSGRPSCGSFVDLIAIELADHGTVLEHDHAGRALDHVFEFRGDHHDPATLVGELLDE
jgi:hypothetical protein